MPPSGAGVPYPHRPARASVRSAVSVSAGLLLAIVLLLIGIAARVRADGPVRWPWPEHDWRFEGNRATPAERWANNWPRTPSQAEIDAAFDQLRVAFTDAEHWRQFDNPYGLRQSLPSRSVRHDVTLTKVHHVALDGPAANNVMVRATTESFVERDGREVHENSLQAVGVPYPATTWGFHLLDWDRDRSRFYISRAYVWQLRDERFPYGAIVGGMGVNNPTFFRSEADREAYIAARFAPGWVGTGGEEPGLWTVRYGDAAAVAAAAVVIGAAIAAARAAFRKRSKGRPPAAERYILQVGQRQVELEAGGAPQALDIACWAVGQDGIPKPAPQARIQVTAPGLSVTPAAGQGTLRCLLQAAAVARGGEVAVAITAAVPAGSPVAETVTARVMPACRLELSAADPAARLSAGTQGAVWLQARVVAPATVPAADVEAATRAIRFDAAGPNAAAIALSPPTDHQGWRWVQVSLQPRQPGGAGRAPGGVEVAASTRMGTRPLHASLQLNLSDVVLAAAVRGATGVVSDVPWDDTARTWSFPEAIVFFKERDGDKPVAPSFRYGFPTPPIEVQPTGAVDVGEFFGHGDHSYTLRFRPRAEALARLFAADPGRPQAVQVTVVAQADGGRRLDAKLAFRVLPALVLRARPAELAVKAGEPARLELAVCAAGPQGDGPDERGVPITTEWPRDRGVAVVPAGGPSPLCCEVRVDDPSRATSFAIEASAVAPGGARLQARVQVEVGLVYEVDLVGERLEPLAGRTLDPGELGTILAGVVFDASERPPAPTSELTRQIAFTVRGPNAQRVRLAPPTFEDPRQCARATWQEPPEGVALESDDPEVVLGLRVGGRRVERAVKLSLADCRLRLLERALARIASELSVKGAYVKNRLQGLPLVDGAYQAYTTVWDYTVGLFNNYEGKTCGDYVAATESAVLQAVRRSYGDKAGLETVVINEASYFETGFRAWCDQWYEDNHVLYRLTLPDGSTKSIDFWESARGLLPDRSILGEWSGTVAVWKNRFGSDFDAVRSFYTQKTLQPGAMHVGSASPSGQGTPAGGRP